MVIWPVTGNMDYGVVLIESDGNNGVSTYKMCVAMNSVAWEKRRCWA
jgi:hypothetical protein